MSFNEIQDIRRIKIKVFYSWMENIAQYLYLIQIRHNTVFYKHLTYTIKQKFPQSKWKPLYIVVENCTDATRLSCPLPQVEINPRAGDFYWPFRQSAPTHCFLLGWWEPDFSVRCGLFPELSSSHCCASLHTCIFLTQRSTWAVTSSNL